MLTRRHLVSVIIQWRQRLENFGAMKYRLLIGGRSGCQVGPLPSILSIGVWNFLWCGGNQHLPEKRVWENVVSSSIHQGLWRSPARQRMFRDLQTILSILSHFCATFWLIFLRTATNLPKFAAPNLGECLPVPSPTLMPPEIYLVFYHGNTEYVLISQCQALGPTKLFLSHFRLRRKVS